MLVIDKTDGARVALLAHQIVAVEEVPDQKHTCVVIMAGGFSYQVAEDFMTVSSKVLDALEDEEPQR